MSIPFVRDLDVVYGRVDQVSPLGELSVRWTGDEANDGGEFDIDEIDEFDGAPPEADAAPDAQETPDD